MPGSPARRSSRRDTTASAVNTSSTVYVTAGGMAASTGPSARWTGGSAAPVSSPQAREKGRQTRP